MSTTTPHPDARALRETAAALGLPFLDAIPETAYAPDLASAIPLAWARSQCVLPVRLDGREILLTSDPADLESQQRASLAAGRPFQPAVAPREAIAAAIERCYASGADADAGQFIRDLEEKSDEASPASGAADGAAESPRASVSDLLEGDESAPVTRLVNLILLEAVRERASDIHFEPFAGRLAVRFRIDGVLYRRAEPPKHMEAALVSRLKVMAGMDIAERRLPQDGMAQAKVGEKSLDIRVSTVPVADGERVVLRLLNRDDTCLPMTSLGMDADLLASFRSLLRTPNGIIIVSGPTGSGKTTTLYSALGEIDSARRNVLTIEDPVEYRLPNVGQIQVKPKIGLTFASGLRHILRQDPDVVLVGETRDAETAEIAVRASLTGHLVFTTLHTNDAPSAVMRLVDMGVQPYLLASCLRGVLGQRLVRRLCPHCAAAASFEEAARRLDLPSGWADRLRGIRLRRAVGCGQCLDGYAGRSGIFELMAVTPDLRDAIRRGAASAADLRAAALANGMRTLADDAFAKVVAGETDLVEAAAALAD